MLLTEFEKIGAILPQIKVNNFDWHFNFTDLGANAVICHELWSNQRGQTVSFSNGLWAMRLSTDDGPSLQFFKNNKSKW